MTDRWGGRSHLAALLLIVLWGALLRADVLVQRYGPFDGPAWLRGLNAAPGLAAPVRPPGFVWHREPRPYVGGDPINYLRFAREMRGFYQGHVREPVFLALTRTWLWLTGGRDIAVSLASASASLAAVPATWALGAAAATPLVGLFAATLLASDYDAVAWSPDGWRDDTFMLTVTLAALAFLRLRELPSRNRALIAGAAAALACLTRITAVSFVVPAFALIVLDGPRRSIRQRLGAVALAALVAALLVAPYLINTARASGDPLLALNAHTRYYRAAEGLPAEGSQPASAYIAAKIRHRPIAALDTALTGLFVVPIENKAPGFGFWWRWLPLLLQGLMAAGLVAWSWHPGGRLLVVLTLASLLPYALTWNLGGGGEWRFTMHVYPLLLVAAGSALRGGVRLATGRAVPLRRAHRWSIAAALLLAGGAVVGYRQLPFFVAREAILRGDSTTVGAGARDGVFFRQGWLPPRTDGNVTARLSDGARAILRVPLPRTGEAYTLVFRLDPVTARRPSSLTVLLNRTLVGHLDLRLDPARVGSYDLPVPAALVGRRHNDIELVADTTVPAAQADPRYAFLPDEQAIAFRLWYVRIIPDADSQSTTMPGPGDPGIAGARSDARLTPPQLPH